MGPYTLVKFGLGIQSVVLDSSMKLLLYVPFLGLPGLVQRKYPLCVD